MTLQEIFDCLRYSELAQLNLGTAEGAELEASWDRLLPQINLGLIELHKRFLLREGQVLLRMQPGQRAYRLDPGHALSTPEVPGVAKYLIDSLAEPFTGDVLKVERVHTAMGEELLLNRSGDGLDLALRSVRSPTPTSLILPPDLPAQDLLVVYRAGHPKIERGGAFAPESVELDLPSTHLEALLYYVASRLINPNGVAGNTAFHEGNNYYAKFEAACQLLVDLDFRNQEGVSDYRLERNGWV